MSEKIFYTPTLFNMYYYSYGNNNSCVANTVPSLVHMYMA